MNLQKMALIGAAVSVCTASIIVAACKSSGSSESDRPAGKIASVKFDKAALLKSFGQCALDEYRVFATAAADLDAQTAVSGDREKARASFKAAMEIWSRAELYQFGPAAIATAPGGRSMRALIYGWPLSSRCEIEQALVSKAYETPNWATTALPTARTLTALEYLLFYEGTDNACVPANAINAGGTWAAIPAPELATRKNAFAKVVAADLLSRANQLVDAWDPAKANFIGEMEKAGRSTAFPTEQSAFNAVSDAMFYLDAEVKNMKVGAPAGLLPQCSTPPCLEMVESPYAKVSKSNIRANVVGYDRLLRGCGTNGEGQGFDDLLTAVGAEATAKKLDDSVAAIRVALDALTEPTFEEDLQKNPNGVKALFDAFRSNASVMKSEMVTVLDLELPKKVEGDND